jgi:YD repeat-containing protein
MKQKHTVAITISLVYVVSNTTGRVRRIRLALPGFSIDDVAFASEDGSEVYMFSGVGRHLRTLDALTGAMRYEFAYDPDGRLLSVTDGDGNLTTVERDDSGLPTTIVGPYGQRTELTLDPNHYLGSITNPAGEAYHFSSTAGGLLTSLTTPRGHASLNTYDGQGRLIRHSDPAGGFKELTRIGDAGAYSVTLTTALSRTTTYLVQDPPSGDQRRVTTDPAGLEWELIKGAGDTRLTTAPDGTERTAVLGPDPRWAMQTPTLASASLATPGGLTVNSAEQRSAVLAYPHDPMSLVRLDEQIAINGGVYASSYLSATRTMTNTSPAGRQVLTVGDDQSRPLLVEVPGLLPLQFTYDERGRLSTAVQGSRTFSSAYNSEGYPAVLTDPLGRTRADHYLHLRRAGQSDGGRSARWHGDRVPGGWQQPSRGKEG